MEITALDEMGGEIWVLLWFNTANGCMAGFVQYPIFITNATQLGA